MKRLMLLFTPLLTACGAWPQAFQTLDDIATDDAIKVYVDKDAFKKDTDVHVVVDVINKDTAKNKIDPPK